MQSTGTHPVVESRPAPPAPRGRTDGAIALAAAVVSALVFLVVHRGLIDDAYITLSYARNLAENFHWGLTEFRPANTATSPLNVLLLAAGTFLVRDGVWGLGLVYVVLNALQAWGLNRLADRLQLARWTGLLAWLLVLLSPLMLSIVGMEMTLAVTLVVWLTLAAVESRPVAFGVLTAALALTRLDLLLFPLLLVLSTRALQRRLLPIAATALALSLPWYFFSWLVLGGLLPDTLAMKAGLSWGPFSFWNGPILYRQRYPVATVLTLVPAAVGGVALVAWFATAAWRRPRWRGLGPMAAVGAAGVLHYLVYVKLGPAPYHWYYAPSASALILVAAVAGGRLAADRRSASSPAPPRSLRVALAGAVAVALVAVDVGFVVARLPWDQVPIGTNWATAQQYRTIGEALRQRARGEVVGSPGEIGTLAYYCRCDIVDGFADRGLIVPVIDDRERRAGPLMRALIRFNFAHFDRSVAPADQTLALVYVDGSAPDDGGWPVSSHWVGAGSIVLEPASSPHQ